MWKNTAGKTISDLDAAHRSFVCHLCLSYWLVCLLLWLLPGLSPHLTVPASVTHSLGWQFIERAVRLTLTSK